MPEEIEYERKEVTIPAEEAGETINAQVKEGWRIEKTETTLTLFLKRKKEKDVGDDSLPKG